MIVIVDYGAGNLTSVRLAFEAAGVPATVAADARAVREAARVVLPGVGAAGAAMRNLNALGLVDALRASVARGAPFLGICLGAQVVFERSEEDGGVNGLGFLPGTVRLFRPASRWDKVPQMGWNAVVPRRAPGGAAHPLFAGIAEGSEFYFVHSYYPAPSAEACVLAETEYAGVRFASAVGRDNLFATQFHPEKSGRAGLQLIANFAKWNGKS